MKTIAVSEKAYTRLASWKTGRDDTFSAVIERLIPPKGTLDAALEAAEGKVSGPGGAADLLGINPNTLASRLRAFGIQVRRSGF